MTDLHPVAMPPVNGTVEYLSGTIQRLSDSRFYAVIPGRRGCLTSYKTTQPDAAFRQAYNYLRRDAGLPKLPRLCSQCGERPTWKQSHKCMACSRPKRNASQLAQEREISDLNANKPSGREIRNTTAKTNGDLSASSEPVEILGAKLSIARRCADEIITRRGGRVPYSPSFEEYLYKWQLKGVE